MFALVDCNNFYASCERLFRPELRGKPVVVLSNNDGCVIARSQESKDLGIKMGTPWHFIQKEMKHLGVVQASSNYTLYADISARVMQNLARFTPNIEVYSIDESFLDLSGFSVCKTNLNAYGRLIRKTVLRNTGIPVGVGIAPTKTLAKIANKLSKKSKGVCVLNTPEKITEALQDFPIEDIWGIGGASAKKLWLKDIKTALHLREQPLDWVQKTFTIQGARMWYELHGRSCLPLSQVFERKKGVCTSRAFGKLTDNYGELEEATTNYASRLSEKLRKDRSCATLLSVRLLTNQFRKELPQIYPVVLIKLPHPTNNTLDLVKYSLEGLKKVYVKGYLFLKVELLATGLIPESEVQLNLFESYKGKERNKVSEVMDRLNLHFGKGTLRIATEGKTHAWTMRRQFLSPSFTTKWEDIIRVG